MMVRAICSAFLMALFAAGGALACTVPPERMSYRHEAAIEEAEWIALVRALPGEAGRSARLQVLDYLKGRGARTLRLGEIGTHDRYNPDSLSPVAANFYGHVAEEFWRAGSFRARSGVDCRAHPVFAPGNMYLVFGPQEYGIGYENVVGASDQWVSYVREQLEGVQSIDPPNTLDSYLGDAAAVLRMEVHWSTDGISTRETLLSGRVEAIRDSSRMAIYNYLTRELDPACRRARANDPSGLDLIIAFAALPENGDDDIEPVDCTRARPSENYGPRQSDFRDSWEQYAASERRRTLSTVTFVLDGCDAYVRTARRVLPFTAADGAPIEMPIPASRFGITDC